MSELINITTSIFNDLQIGANPIVDNFVLMKSPLPIISVISVYLLFVLVIGPKWMASRKPFKMNYILIFYNLYQVAFSIWFLSGAFKHRPFRNHVFNLKCLDRRDKIIERIIHYDGWWFVLCKLVELLDTVFFVLRKKYNQVTFLHVFHHTHMVLVSWIGLKYFPGEQLILVVVFVTMEHVIMYFYYLLCALAPKFSGILRMKKITTRLQIMQFVLLLTYFTYNIIRGCRMQKSMLWLVLGSLTFYLILYLKFYQTLYGKHSIHQDMSDELEITEDCNNNDNSSKNLVIDKKLN